MITKGYVLKSLLITVISVFAIHWTLLKFANLQSDAKDFYYSIPLLYLIFFTFSAIILVVVYQVSVKSFDNTGMVFMLSTTIKTAISYIIAHPVIQKSNEMTLEKINFFSIFIVFLAIESLITIKILNKKQVKSKSNSKKRNFFTK